ncbi:uncharacterized protein LOC126787530 [Argentina anserina]|uniref:uncharacterized protein LOC126787530 n=1 Tax=Argentina anserina TaxID=57926 RepID=UPI0021766E53|nr:uncharacterized protein LOC126787530 [Potentilla anserina]
MDLQIINRALQESCNDIDIDATIESLSKLQLTENRVTSGPAEKILQDQNPVNEDGSTDWVELVIGEMMTCTSVEDARARAAKVLKGFEKSIGASFEKENMVLKHAVCVLLKRRKEQESGSRELRQLKELVAHQQERLRALEATNYGLNLHLKQALQCSSHFVPSGKFNPDVF